MTAASREIKQSKKFARVLEVSKYPGLVTSNIASLMSVSYLVVCTI